MTVDEWLGLAAFAIVTLAFLRVGNRRGAMLAVTGVAVGGYLAAAGAGSARWEALALTGLGIALYSAGLTLFGAVLERSVTLEILRRASAGDAEVRGHAALARRAEELVASGLARREGERLRLTRAGRVAVALASTARVLVRDPA